METSYRPISQIPQYIRKITHNASFCNRNVHTRAHFCYKIVHCRIWVWSIVGFVILSQLQSFLILALADAVAFAAGLSIPNVPVPGVPSIVNTLYIARTGDFKHAGRVVAFEFNARVVGDVEFVVKCIIYF